MTERSLIDGSFKDVAKFLHTTEDLNTSKLGEYLGAKYVSKRKKKKKDKKRGKQKNEKLKYSFAVNRLTPEYCKHL